MSKLQDVLDLFDSLSPDEKQQVRQAVGSKLKGHLEYRVVKRGEKTFGPYRHLRLWVDGKLTDKYLGKASEDEVSAWKARREGVSSHQPRTDPAVNETVRQQPTAESGDGRPITPNEIIARNKANARQRRPTPQIGKNRREDL